MDMLLVSFEQSLSSYSANTRLAYRRDIQEFIQFLHSSGYMLDSLTTQEVSDYFAFLLKRKVSIATINRKNAALRYFFIYLTEQHKFPDFTPLLASCNKYSLEKLAELIEQYKKGTTYHELRLCILLSLLATGKLGITRIHNLHIADFCDQTRCIKIKDGKRIRSIELSEQFFVFFKSYQTCIPFVSPYLFPVKSGSFIKPISRQALWSLLKTVLAPQESLHLIDNSSFTTEPELKETYTRKHPRS